MASPLVHTTGEGMHLCTKAETTFSFDIFFHPVQQGFLHNPSVDLNEYSN